jgi:hypothetical protein
MPSKSEVVGTLRSVAHLLEPIKYQTSTLDLMFGRRAGNVAGPGTPYSHIPDLRELRAAGPARTQLPADGGVG